MKLKTGIAGLDEFLQGGLPPSVLLLQGAPGSGNEVFARQVALSRAKQSGTSYFTFMKTPDSVREEMATYGWEVSPLEEKDRWRFITLSQTAPLAEAVSNEMEEHRCLVFDSLSELLLTRKVEEVIDALSSMVIKNRQCRELHLILLTEGMQDPKVETAIQHFTEGVITFSTAWETEFASKNMIMKKMKGIFAPSRRLPYSIGERGFTIETAIRIT